MVIDADKGFDIRAAERFLTERKIEAYNQGLPEATNWIVDQQIELGVDIVNDGEISKRGLFIGYIRDRMSGFEERSFPPGSYPAGVQNPFLLAGPATAMAGPVIVHTLA